MSRPIEGFKNPLTLELCIKGLLVPLSFFLISDGLTISNLPLAFYQRQPGLRLQNRLLEFLSFPSGFPFRSTHRRDDEYNEKRTKKKATVPESRYPLLLSYRERSLELEVVRSTTVHCRNTLSCWHYLANKDRTLADAQQPHL